MKVLLMSIKAGFGHHSTAMAIMEKFEENGDKCEMLDIFEYINPRLGNTIQDGYLLSTKYLSYSYGKVYNNMAEKNTPYKNYSITALLSKLISKKLSTYIKDFAPDLVIGTHSYAGVVMTILSGREVISCPTVGIVTDFTVHPFWESTKLDCYVVPDKRLTFEMQKKGIPADKILPTGIPIRKQFEKKTEKAEARKALKIADKRTVLLMMGSMGYGNIKKTLTDIDSSPEDFQVLCICGSNRRMQRAVARHEWEKKIYSYGFVKNIDLMMDASDVIVSKPGGLTTSETLAKGLPMIVVNPIPGQEDRNLSFLLNNGAVIGLNETYTMQEALNNLFAYPERLEELKTCADRLGKPHATETLYNFCKEKLLANSGSTENVLPDK